MWCEVWSKQKVEWKVMMNVSRLSFVFTRNSKNEIQRDSIGRSSAAWDRTTQGFYLFPFERNAADKKREKLNRLYDINVDTDRWELE